ncbi:MAG: hypothetical protein GX654_06980 [Desulfatiglans sp.]|nr:hypothetical protein [Desulfatiglans sp.]
MILKTMFLLNPNFLGIYILSDKICLYDHKKNKDQEFLFDEQMYQKNIEENVLNTLPNVFVTIRKLFKRWPPLRVILCGDINLPTLTKPFIEKIAEIFNLEIYSIDYKLCIAVGIGLDISELKKHIIFISSDSYVQGYILFGSKIINEMKIQISEEVDTEEAISVLLKELKATIDLDIKTFFYNAKFSNDTYNEIDINWRLDFQENINLISINNKPILIKRDFGIFKIKIFDNGREYIKKGINEFCKAAKHLGDNP